MLRISYRLCATFIVLPVPAGCAGLSWPHVAEAQRPGPDSWTAPATAGARYDFHWRLSGEKRIAPLQVFDDGARTWLHFAPGQAVPAIFADDGLAQVPVAYQHKPPYVVIDGKWPAIVLRAGGLQARAVYAGAAGSSSRHDTGERAGNRGVATAGNASAPSAVVSTGALAGIRPTTDEAPHAGAYTAALSGARAAGLTAATAAATAAAATAAATAGDRPPHSSQIAGRGAPASAHAPWEHRDAAHGASHMRVADAPSAAPAATAVYAALPGDGNMRRTLARWAHAAGWLFGPEHWDVDVDIPLAGSAAFGAEFKAAVRGLIGATEMGDKPLQPCFYANQVLRVVAATHSCDRSASRTGEPV